MNEYRIGYRFNNNEVQGFKGIGFNKKTAEINAYKKIHSKLEFLTEKFNQINTFLDDRNLNIDEKKRIKEDFNN